MQLRLKTRLSMGLAAMGAAMAVVVILLALTYNTASRNIAQVHANYLPSLELTNRLLIRIERMENQEFLFIAPGEDREAHIRQFDLEARAFERLYQELQPLAMEEDELEKYAEIGRHYGAYLHVNGRMRELLAAGRREEARSINLAESVPLSRRMREAAEVLHSHNWAESQQAKNAAVSALQRSTTWAAALLLLGGLVAVGVYQRTARAITQPLQALRQAAAGLERGEHPQVDSPWAFQTVELAELQAAFNRTSDALERLAADLKAANSNLEAQVASRTQELRAANQQLAALVEELKTLDKLKSDFMAVVSHELLTPINFVSGYGSALEDGVMGELSPEQAQALHQMMTGTERLTRMVRNVLDYTRLESGRLPLHPEPFDAAALARDTVEGIKTAFDGRANEIEVHLPSTLPEAWADPGRVDQILRELLDNAIKFTTEGQRIWLRAEATDGAVAIEVGDTGEGVPPQALAQIFQPFFQADLTSTRRHGGLGLGLAIAHGLAQQMGAELTARSTPGQGSVFRLRLPLAEGRTYLP